eukprot:15365254-Ditylum_brightwellii.AAC.2
MESKGIRTGKSRDAGITANGRDVTLVPDDVFKTLLHLQQCNNTRRHVRTLHGQQRHSGKDALAQVEATYKEMNINIPTKWVNTMKNAYVAGT